MEKISLHFYKMSRPALGSTQSPIHWYQRFLPGEKEQLEHDVDPFSSSNAKINTLRTGDADLCFYITTVQEG